MNTANDQETETSSPRCCIINETAHCWLKRHSREMYVVTYLAMYRIMELLLLRNEARWMMPKIVGLCGYYVTSRLHMSHNKYCNKQRKIGSFIHVIIFKIKRNIRVFSLCHTFYLCVCVCLNLCVYSLHTVFFCRKFVNTLFVKTENNVHY